LQTYVYTFEIWVDNRVVNDQRRPARSEATKTRILEAARLLFAEKGFERTTIRLVAKRAVIHPSLVMRYFGTKENLFAVATKFDLRLPDLSGVAKDKRGEFFARYFLKRWEGPNAGDELLVLLRVAATHPGGKAQLGQIFQRQLVPAIAKLVPRERAARCAALFATQMLGLAFARYILRLPAVLSLTEDEIVANIGATLQSYLEIAERHQIRPHSKRAAGSTASDT
jgi:AcrR family transcriptional regulator